MANKISLTQENINYLRYAFAHFFPEDTIYAADKPYVSGEFNWKDRRDFIDFVYRLTGVSIKSERDFANIKKAQLAVEDLVSIPGTEEKPAESNMPDKWAREAQEAERKKRETELKETKEKAQKEVRESLQKKEEIKRSLENKIREQKEVQEALGNKKVYAKVEIPQPQEVNENTKQFIDQAKNYPQSFRKEISGVIKQKISASDFAKNLSGEEVSILADKIANDTIFAISSPSKQTEINLETAILNFVAKKPDIAQSITSNTKAREFLATAPAEVAFFNNSTQLSRNVLSSVDKNLASAVFGPDPSEIIVTLSTQPTEGYTHEVDLHKLSDGYTNILESQSNLLENVSSFGKDQVQGFLLGQTRTFLDSQIARLPADSAVSGIYNSAIGQKSLDLVGLTKYTPLEGNLFGSIIQRIPGASGFFEGLGISATTSATEIAGVTTIEGASLVGGSAVIVETGINTVQTATIAVSQPAKLSLNVALGNAVVKATSSMLGRIGLTTASAKVGAMMGTGIVPVIGTVVGLVVGAVIGKVLEKLWPKIKKFAPYIIGGTLGIGAFAVAGPTLGIVVGAGAFVASSTVTGGPVTLTGIGLGIGRFFRSFGKTTKSIVIPILMILMITPIVVALILFVINSGAYVVPPTTTTGLGSNPYIQVTKIPNPTGPFKNSELPLKIDYSITITAKKNTLSNISIKDTCQMITKAGTKDCPSSVPSDIPSDIFTSSPYTYSYNETYSGTDYVDSLVINTVTITADSADGSRQEVITTAAIKIGNPPEDCPSGSWPLAGNVGLNDVTQGPLAPSCSHRNLKQAIDIGVAGESIVAVHSGIATVGQESCVGKYIKITSTCGSNSFSTLYGHLGTVSIQDGQRVVLGQFLGLTDNTGSCTTGNHLHFEFQAASVPTVQTPYLIRNIPVGCCSRTTCNP